MLNKNLHLGNISILINFINKTSIYSNTVNQILYCILYFSNTRLEAIYLNHNEN